MQMQAKHTSNSCKCITRLIASGSRHYYTRHYYAALGWSYTNFVHSTRTPRTARKTPPCEGREMEPK